MRKISNLIRKEFHLVSSSETPWGLTDLVWGYLRPASSEQHTWTRRLGSITTSPGHSHHCQVTLTVQRESEALKNRLCSSRTSCKYTERLRARQIRCTSPNWPRPVLKLRASLVAQRLRSHLPMQGTQVRALVREDPTCRGATKPMCHNYWAREPQLLKPGHLEPMLCNKRSHRKEKPAHHNKE